VLHCSLEYCVVLHIIAVAEALLRKWPFAADSGLSEEEEGETSQDARDSDEEFQLAPWEKGIGNPMPEQSSIR
jgi:hypothetical protein